MTVVVQVGAVNHLAFACDGGAAANFTTISGTSVQFSFTRIDSVATRVTAGAIPSN